MSATVASAATAIVRSCPSCGRRNRVPPDHLADTGRCGACQQPLPPLDEPLDADSALFEAVAGGSAVPVLVDFWAAWCGPCRMAAPEVKRAAQTMAGRAVVLKVDTEAHPDLAARFGVRGIPNFIVMRNGQVVRQQAGLVAHAQLQAWLEEAGA